MPALDHTHNAETNSDERIRKIYVRDLKPNEVTHTVFRAARKEKHTSRGGKTFLALTLVDRTGAIEGRVFDNVDAADQAFSADDFLLVKGKVGQFHGKPQMVVDRLERLDPGPIDAQEFAWSPPPPVETPAAPRDAREEEPHRLHLTKRLTKALEDPKVAQALDVLLMHLEKAAEERLGRTSAASAASHPDRPDRRNREPRKPRVEHLAKVEHVPKADSGSAPKAESKRDPSLPEGLAFKPFNALVGEGQKPEPTNS